MSSINVKVLLVLSLSILLNYETYAQPNWLGGTPIVTPIPGGFNIDLEVDEPGWIYYIVYTGDVYAGGRTSPLVKSLCQGGPSGILVRTDSIAYAGGNITEWISGLNPSSGYTIFITFENGSGVFVSPWAFRNYDITLACPPIQLFTFFGNSGECVNLGANGVFQAAPLGVLPTGVLQGTVWTIDWGDGTPMWTYTSTADDDIPPPQIHPFLSTTDCNYVGTWTIQNPCGEFLNGSAVFVVHGRDIPADGDGFIEIVDNATGSTTIEVCEGTETTVVLRDNSTWNCQNPTVPIPLTADPNDDPRNLQWYYGENPAGGVTNTITGDVAISALGNANGGGGVWDLRHAPSPMAPGEISESITIPATAVAGEYFRVYLKNWNKCNWADPNYVDGFVDILVIDAPDAPTVPNRDICFGDNRTLSVSGAPVGEFRWYDDALKTTLIQTGSTYTPPQTAVGAYDFWVSDAETSGLACESPLTQVTLTIWPLPEIDRPVSDDEICNGETATVTVDNTQNGVEYILRLNSNNSLIDGPIAGNGGTIAFSCSPTSTETYNVLARFTTGPLCEAELTDISTVTVNPLANITSQSPVIGK